jgi:hypothetical protein
MTQSQVNTIIVGAFIAIIVIVGGWFALRRTVIADIREATMNVNSSRNHRNLFQGFEVRGRCSSHRGTTDTVPTLRPSTSVVGNQPRSEMLFNDLATDFLPVQRHPGQTAISVGVNLAQDVVRPVQVGVDGLPVAGPE